MSNTALQKEMWDAYYQKSGVGSDHKKDMASLIPLAQALENGANPNIQSQTIKDTLFERVCSAPNLRQPEYNKAIAELLFLYGLDIEKSLTTVGLMFRDKSPELAAVILTHLAAQKIEHGENFELPIAEAFSGIGNPDPAVKTPIRTEAEINIMTAQHAFVDYVSTSETAAAQYLRNLKDHPSGHTWTKKIEKPNELDYPRPSRAFAEHVAAISEISKDITKIISPQKNLNKDQKEAVQTLITSFAYETQSFKNNTFKRSWNPSIESTDHQINNKKLLSFDDLMKKTFVPKEP